jgi:hypothetical protein
MIRRVLISADHGTAIIYFLQSDLVPTLLESGIEVILLTDDEISEQISQKFHWPGLYVESLRLSQASNYAGSFRPRIQWLLSSYLRRVGGSVRMNTEAMDSHIWEVWQENSWKFRLGVWLPAAFLTFLLRNSVRLRKLLVQIQQRYIPSPGLYSDLLDKYQPSLVIAATPGWRLDRYLLREARERLIPTMTTIVGWDNPSSYSIPGAQVDYANCWSEEQKRELVLGSDWDPKSIHIGGVPSYDGYIHKEWVIPRQQYFKLHGLDPQRKLISYACSFVHFAPNYLNIEALAGLISSEALIEPAQLIVRLHPSHFQDKPRIFAEERDRILALEGACPLVHVVKPIPLGGSLGYYGGEDMDEKSSMMAHSDVFVTVYSTMVVECAIHDRPIVAAVLDTPGGWNKKGKYSLSLKDIGNWPTHKRFRDSQAGRIAENEEQLRAVLNAYLADPNLDGARRKKFVEQEITFTDGSAGKRTAKFILKVLNN